MAIKLILKKKASTSNPAIKRPLQLNIGNNDTNLNIENVDFNGELVDESVDITSTSSTISTPSTTKPKPKKRLKMDSLVKAISTTPITKCLLQKPITNTVEWKWSDLGLPIQIQNYLNLNFPQLTEIQKLSIPSIITGQDLLGVAPTGSGKTLSFLVPLLKHVIINAKSSNQTLGLVLVPTRELCVQIHNQLQLMSSLVKISSVACFGGVNIASQISDIHTNGNQIVVATPGRLIDLLASNNGKVLNVGKVSFLAIDEIDRMFDMGFGPQVKTILNLMREDKQTVLFSATLSTGMEKLVTRILKNFVDIRLDTMKIPTAVTQRALFVKNNQKFSTLQSLLNEFSNDQALIFVNTQERADDLSLKLRDENVKCQSLHGGMDQQDRSYTLRDFINKELRVLIATSIAARGLDVEGLKLVINYDPASHVEDYVHRAGRTGRAGGSGTCVTFISESQNREAFELSKFTELDGELKDMALSYSEEHGDDVDKRGFLGHGLAKLDAKRKERLAVESAAYSQENTDLVVCETDMNGVVSAKLVINDAPQKARVLVTTASTQVKVSADYNVQLTLRGRHVNSNSNSNSQRLANDQLLHIYIEGGNEEDVRGAYNRLSGILASGSESLIGTEERNYDLV